jgi:hypothetical protein
MFYSAINFFTPHCHSDEIGGPARQAKHPHEQRPDEQPLKFAPKQEAFAHKETHIESSSCGYE